MRGKRAGLGIVSDRAGETCLIDRRGAGWPVKGDVPLAVILPEQGFYASAGCFEYVVVADDGARGHGLNTIGLDGRPLTDPSAVRIAGIEECVLSPALSVVWGSGEM